MKITKVSAELYQVPTRREMHDAIRQFSVMDMIFAPVATDEGASGLGFTYNIIRHSGREIELLINEVIEIGDSKTEVPGSSDHSGGGIRRLQKGLRQPFVTVFSCCAAPLEAKGK